MVNGVLPFQNDLRNGDEGIALFQQALNDTRQGFGSVLRCIMEQNDRTRLDFTCHSLGNVCCGQVFPVQAVHVPYRGKSLGATDFLSTTTKVSLHYRRPSLGIAMPLPILQTPYTMPHNITSAVLSLGSPHNSLRAFALRTIQTIHK